MRTVNGADVDRLGSAREVLGVYDAIACAPAVVGCEPAARAVDINGDNSRRRPKRLGLVVVCGGHHESRPQRHGEFRGVAASDDGARLVVPDPDAGYEPWRVPDEPRVA